MPSQLLLWLRIRGGGDRIAGTVGRPEQAPIPFDGWIDLMGALEQLRRTMTSTAEGARDEQGPAGPGTPA